MSSFRRFLLLAFFAAIGVGLAVYLAVSTPAEISAHGPIAAADHTVDFDTRQTDSRQRSVDDGPHELPVAVSDSSEAQSLQDTGNPLRARKQGDPSAKFGEPSGAARARTLPHAIAAAVTASPHPPVAEQVQVSKPVPIGGQVPTAQVASGNNAEATIPVSMVLDLVDRMFRTNNQPVTRVPQPPPEPLPQPGPDSPSAASGDAERPADRRSGEPQNASTLNVVGDNKDRLTLHLKETDVREVFDLLSQGSGRNIVATKSVKGTVTATLQDVPFDTAMRAILKSTGYVARAEGNIVYVGTPEEFETDLRNSAKVTTRIYRPDYIRAVELQNLITPMLSPTVGMVSVTTSAENGIPSDGVNAGGDTYADQEVVLVRDYPWVLDQIDDVFQKVDRRPLQVAIEAMILSVRLDDTNSLGVDFELLRNRDHVRLVSGSPLSDLANLNIGEGGLKLGFLDSSVAAFVNALETIGETDVIATPRLLALNKQRAEILIGAELGYVSTTVTETAQTQTVEFLAVGTQLRIRPFISSDGMIRMEIHPELSTGSVRVEGGFTLPDKEVTEVTTNIIAHDGATVIIGGLIREELTSGSSQIPLFGSLPLVGAAFRQKTEAVERRELLVLITPHIVDEPEMTEEGHRGATEFHHRHMVEFESFNPTSASRISHNYFIKAQNAWSRGNRKQAMKYVNRAIHYGPMNRAAIDLRADLCDGNGAADHAAEAPYLPSTPYGHPPDGTRLHGHPLDGTRPHGHPLDGAKSHNHPLDGPRIDAWILENLDPRAVGGPAGPHTGHLVPPGRGVNIVNP